MTEGLRESYRRFCPQFQFGVSTVEAMTGDADGAVVGLALRFALNARPPGSQGFAAGQANDKSKD